MTLGDLLARRVAHVAALEDLVAVLVDDPALLVHHVVVLEDALADEEVLLLDLPLGLLDLLGEHPGLDRLLVALLVGRARGGRGSCRSGRRRTGGRGRPRRERKKRDSPGSPWRPERPRSWLSIRRDSWRSVPQMNRPPASMTFSRSSSTRASIVGQHLGEALVVVGVAGLEAELGELELGEVLGVAAELDVDAAAGHVRGDRDRAGLAGLGDDLALALGVLGLGVEHRVRDAALAQALAEQLGDLDGDRADEHRLAVARGARRSR